MRRSRKPLPVIRRVGSSNLPPSASLSRPATPSAGRGRPLETPDAAGGAPEKRGSRFCLFGLRDRRRRRALRRLSLFACAEPVSYTHLRAHETRHDLVCRLLLEKKNKKNKENKVHKHIKK